MRDLIFKWLKIPAEPDPPSGSHASVRTFRAAKNFYYVLFAKWVTKQIGVLVGFGFAFFYVLPLTERLPGMLPMLIRVLEVLGVLGFIFQMVFTLILVRLDYELRWYIVTDRSIRIRAGVWDIREMTMTFANIQHASIHQGPLQRALGISDVLVRTAGGGAGLEASHQHQKGAGEMMHVAYFHGVDNAEEIKELIQDRMRRYQDAGLGDPDEDVETDGEDTGVDEPSELLAAAREFAAEAAALRSSMAERPS